MKLIIIFISIVLTFVVSGCCTPEQPPYTGKTETMTQVVAEINANNSKVPTLWGHHFYEGDIVDDKKHNHHVSGDGVLLYLSPMSLRLRANSVVGNIFEIGSNPNVYWLKLGPEAGDTMYWGKYADFAKMNPDETGLPIRPDMVLDVLGIATINANFNAMPIPTMRFDPYADAYVFIWSGKLPNRWVALREVWYDRVTKLPKLVLVYDMNGRVVLRAEFNNPKVNVNGRPKLEMKFYRQVQVPGTPKEQWPLVPTNYTLIFPETGSKLVFSLDEVEIKRKVDEGFIPIPENFVMPSVDDAGVNRVIQIGE